ncbi:MAG: dTDP-glucose 4,6-dehydratase [Planctomycetota bacterium]|jgi:dTDP-glucose 4,6-dehydratase
MRVLVTGGAGFIGSNFVRLLLAERPGWQITNVDLLTYAGNLRSLEDVLEEPRHEFVRADIADGDGLRGALNGHYDLIFNFAAESHVDRSIVDASDFIRTNVLGVQLLLDLARERGWGRFVQISTDEVYGSLGEEGRFTEETVIDPTSPYSASKASADFLALATHKTHEQDVVITRCSNNYGPYQFPEKLIPLMVLSALEDQPLPVYGDGLNIRDWIHVEDHCRAVLSVGEAGLPGRVYNVGADSERTNIVVVREILRILGKPESLIRFVEDRPAHDRRYAIESTRIRQELAWAPRREFEKGIEETVTWYQTHRDWCDDVRSGDYLGFYERWYGERLDAKG